MVQEPLEATRYFQPLHLLVVDGVQPMLAEESPQRQAALEAVERGAQDQILDLARLVIPQAPHHLKEAQVEMGVERQTTPRVVEEAIVLLARLRAAAVLVEAEETVQHPRSLVRRSPMREGVAVALP